VKQQADIVKVIEGYIRLRKGGAQNFTGLCPFHKEKTPSFNVNATRQFFYCFGCQAKGEKQPLHFSGGFSPSFFRNSVNSPSGTFCSLSNSAFSRRASVILPALRYAIIRL